jgi:hypothetical protein
MPTPLALALDTLVLMAASAHAAVSGSFTFVRSMNQFRRAHTSSLLQNGQVLIAGGAPVGPAAVSEVYDPVAQTWTNSGALNKGREFHTATVLRDGKVLVGGGQSPKQLGEPGFGPGNLAPSLSIHL